MVANGAGLSRVVGVTTLADAFSAHQLFVGFTVGASLIRSGLSARRADGADSTDAAKSLKASASLSAGIVLLVGSAFLGADAILVGVESTLAVTVACLGVVVRVDWASDTVSVADEVPAGAFLAHSAHQAITIKADASVGCSRVSSILTADKDALLGG